MAIFTSPDDPESIPKRIGGIVRQRTANGQVLRTFHMPLVRRNSITQFNKNRFAGTGSFWNSLTPEEQQEWNDASI